MNNWLVLALLGYLFYAISSSVDKSVMNRGHDPSKVNALKMLFVAIILFILGYAFYKLDFSFALMRWTILLGGLYALSGVLYFHFLKIKNVSEAVPILQSAPLLFISILSVLLFQESLSVANYFGLLGIVLGIYLLVVTKTSKLANLNQSIFLIFGITVIAVSCSLLTKYILFSFQPINVAIMMYSSATLWLFLYQTYIFRGFSYFKELSIIDKKPILFASFFAAVGTLLIYLALSVGEASKVFAITGAQTMAVVFIGYFFLKEKLGWYKFTGAFLVVMGIFLISL